MDGGKRAKESQFHMIESLGGVIYEANANVTRLGNGDPWFHSLAYIVAKGC